LVVVSEKNIYAVILAGGSGTRFWPASRVAFPKQLLPLGPSPDSLIRETYRRLSSLTTADKILVATGRHLLTGTRGELPELPESSFLGEPSAKNTAPCIAWAVERIARRDPNALVVVVPSDQYIENEARFLGCLDTALRSAELGSITVLGIEPTRPETGYGYIQAGAQVDAGIWKVKRFVEKPNRSTAEEYLRAGGYYWNAGMFVFRASVFMTELGRYMPKLAEGVRQIGVAATQGREQEAVEELFATTESVSIDYGIMERTEAINVVPADVGWNDLGSFQVAWELASKDQAGNASPEGTVLIDANNNLVMDKRTTPDRRVISLVGVSDMCVIQTDDALLIVPRERCQDVRDVVKALKDSGRGSLT
jgi:mannose-1-phosphate guanylyltransferase